MASLATKFNPDVRFGRRSPGGRAGGLIRIKAGVVVPDDLFAGMITVREGERHAGSDLLRNH
jgi:hypothetical protein